MRVRTKNDTAATLTLKGAVAGIRRAEFEYEIPVGDARQLLIMAEPHLVVKHRHLVPFGDLTWEVDVFEGRHVGLVIAEVELDREDQDVPLPDWVGAEVTDDDRYANASLSRAIEPPRD